ncbi:protein of unknown function [Hyphomicrobium sp. 1Nfss2.1]
MHVRDGDILRTSYVAAALRFSNLGRNYPRGLPALEGVSDGESCQRLTKFKSGCPKAAYPVRKNNVTEAVAPHGRSKFCSGGLHAC